MQSSITMLGDFYNNNEQYKNIVQFLLILSAEQ